MGGPWRRLGPLIGLALFIVALLYLWTELRALSPAQIERTMQAMPLSQVGLAIALTLVNYAVLTGYDQLAFIYLNRHFPRWQIGLASFVGYAISNNLGFALLSGASARYRFYSRWGLTAQEISRLVIFYSGTFWLGLLVLGGWGLAVHPPAGLASVRGHQSAPILGVAASRGRGLVRHRFARRDRARQILALHAAAAARTSSRRRSIRAVSCGLGARRGRALGPPARTDAVHRGDERVSGGAVHWAHQQCARRPAGVRKQHGRPAAEHRPDPVAALAARLSRHLLSAAAGTRVDHPVD